MDIATRVTPDTYGTRIDIKPQYDNFIDGRWQKPADGEYFDNLTPVTGQLLTRNARSKERDIEMALDAAHRAAPKWAATAPAERARMLLRIADAMEANLERLATAETWDNGKPIREARAADIPLAIDHFRYFASAIRSQEGGLSEIDHDTVAYHFNEPLGVVGQIIPWNFPILMAAWKLAPALAAGNCVVLAGRADAAGHHAAGRAGRRHPAAGSAQCRHRLRPGSGQAAGLQQAHRQDRLHRRDHHRPPHHAVRVAEHHPGDAGTGRQVAQHLLRQRRRRGRRLLRQGRRRLRDVRAQPGRGLHLPQPSADPGINLREIHGARAQARGGDQAGQSAGRRHHAGRAGVERAAGKILSYLDIGKQEGAQVLAGGARAQLAGALEHGYFVQPTVFKGHNKMRIFQEEIFGPVVAVTTFKDAEDALSQANDTLYGLGAGVWSRDVNTCYRMGRGIKAGRVWTNCYHAYPAHAAFGGYKQSGIGRENHKMMLNHYQQTKNLLVSYSPKKLGFF